MIKTQDCKDFIDGISSTIHSFSDKWKRTRKYKEGNVVLRDFENQNGRVLTIAEHGDKLFLYALAGETFANSSLDTYGNQYIGHVTSEADVLAFIRKCVEEDNEIVYSDAVADALNLSSWVVWNTWTDHQEPDGFSVESLNDFLENANSGQLSLYYGDDNGDEVILSPEEIVQAFWVGMRDYDTAYRIFIFETKDHRLVLGCNEPD